MSTDLLRDLSQHPLARRLGVPRIPVLRRYRPGAPLLDGPAVVGSVGPGRFVDAVRALLKDAGIAEAGEDGTVAAVVLDATAARTLEDLAAVQQFLTPVMRRIGASGRLLLLGPSGDDAEPEPAAVAQGLEGFIRSVGKEMRAGATANLVVAGPGVGPEAVASTLRFFLSARSAFVSGQVVRVGAPVGGRVEDAASDEPLAGRVAVVTGAARGIGAAIAETLARDGAAIVGVDVPAAGEELSRVMNRVGGTAFQLDITAPDAPQRLLTHLRERHGGAHIVVHNAGITRDKLLANMDAERWNAVLAVNLGAQLALNDAFLSAPDVLGTGGRIVCISSMSGIAGNRGQTNYATSKAGVIGMVRALAPRLAERAGTINAIAPGFIETEMTARMPALTREAARRINSLRQGGLPVDVAETVAWLAHPGTGGINGQVVRVDGQNMMGA